MITGSDELNVSLPVRNTGSREGKEVVQLYVRDVKSSVETSLQGIKSIPENTFESG